MSLMALEFSSEFFPFAEMLHFGYAVNHIATANAIAKRLGFWIDEELLQYELYLLQQENMPRRENDKSEPFAHHHKPVDRCPDCFVCDAGRHQAPI